MRGYCCVVCGCSVKDKGQSRVDHVLPRSTHPHLELSLSNLRTLCAAHDNQGHREKGRTGSSERVERFTPVRGCGADGWPTDASHPWNQAEKDGAGVD